MKFALLLLAACGGTTAPATVGNVGTVRGSVGCVFG